MVILSNVLMWSDPIKCHFVILQSLGICRNKGKMRQMRKEPKKWGEKAILRLFLSWKIDVKNY